MRFEICTIVSQRFIITDIFAETIDDIIGFAQRLSTKYFQLNSLVNNAQRIYYTALAHLCAYHNTDVYALVLFHLAP